MKKTTHHRWEYFPAQLSKGKSWEIVFYVQDPKDTESTALKRVRIRFNRIKNLKEREREGRRKVREINDKLSAGWNPFIERESPQAFDYTKDVLERFLSQKKKQAEKGSIREATYTSYASFVANYREWLKENASGPFIISMDKRQLGQFLDEKYYGDDVSARTRNNYLAFFHNLGTWLCEYDYLKYNPAEGITKLKEADKTRQLLNARSVKKLRNYLAVKNPPFLALCMCVYFAFIRRTELTRLKVGALNFEKGTIFIGKEVSKNRRDAVITMPKPLLMLMADHVRASNAHQFIFSDDNYRPGYKPLSPKKISDEWAKLRTKLSFPREYQLYSLKDTGITEMLRQGVPSIQVRDQARHHSISITDTYTPHEVKAANASLIGYTGVF